MPFGLKNKEALAYLVHKFATLIECNISTFYRTDLRWCKVLLEVPHEEVIPEYQWIEYIRQLSEKKVFKVLYSIDHEASKSAPSMALGKCNRTYWKLVAKDGQKWTRYFWSWW